LQLRHWPKCAQIFFPARVNLFVMATKGLIPCDQPGSENGQRWQGHWGSDYWVQLLNVRSLQHDGVRGVPTTSVPSDSMAP